MNSNRGNGAKFPLCSASSLLTSTQPLRHFVPAPPDLHFVSSRTPCGCLVGRQKLGEGARLARWFWEERGVKFTGDGKLDPQIRVSGRSVIEECPPDLGVGQVDDARMTPKLGCRTGRWCKNEPQI